MWTWLTSAWARINFGQYASTALKVIEVTARVLTFVVPIVQALEELKDHWTSDHSDYDMLVDFVKEQVPEEEHPTVVVSRFYDQRYVGETLFGLAVWITKQKVPSSAPFAKLAVELAYLILLLRRQK